MTTQLNGEQIAERLRALPRWTHEYGHLERTYETGEWTRTMMLANAIAFVAEQSAHHPELFLSYPRVKVMLTTHDAGGVTAKDFDLAAKIEELATWHPAGPKARHEELDV